MSTAAWLLRLIHVWRRSLTNRWRQIQKNKRAFFVSHLFPAGTSNTDFSVTRFSAITNPRKWFFFPTMVTQSTIYTGKIHHGFRDAIKQTIKKKKEVLFRFFFIQTLINFLFPQRHRYYLDQRIDKCLNSIRQCQKLNLDQRNSPHLIF